MATAPRNRMEDLRRELRIAGLRATPSRIAVLALLRARHLPLSHGEVADELSRHAWDRATLYRNLVDLTRVGLVRRSDMGDHVWRFQAASGEHGTGRQHPHFVCVDCGTVECLPDVEMSATSRRSRRALRAKDVEVQLRGRCDDCGG